MEEKQKKYLDTMEGHKWRTFNSSSAKLQIWEILLTFLLKKNLAAGK